jgi:hypothetical protein
MSSVSREQDRRYHEQELQKSEYQQALEHLQRKEPLVRQFRTWSEFIAFMREGTSSDPLKEEALLAILKTHAADRDPRWRAVLLAVFWPGLDSIFNRKKRWDTDADERWQNVQWAFLQTVCKLDISRRTDRLVQRIVNGTIHRLHDEYRRVWKLAEREVATDPEQLEECLDGGEEIDFDAMDRRSKQEAEIKRLREHAEAGRISEADFLLLVGTRVYGKSAAQYAREVGISSDLARKRRLRAESAIRRSEER